MRILITGASGMLGKDLESHLKQSGHAVLGTDREVLDITDRDDVLFYTEIHKPEIIINAAAYNFVDKVEEDAIYPIALAINGQAPGYLAEAAKNVGAKFIHYSTDYVFPGEKPEGYREDDAIGPISRYGETKAAGEVAVQDVGGDFYICRLSKLFGRPGLSKESKESFVAIMLRLASTLPELKIVHEEVGSPTYTPDVARHTLDLLTSDLDSGIYHMVNDGDGVTWYEFAEEVFGLTDVSTPRKPVSSADFPKPAKRPRFAALLNTKLPKLRHRKDALKDFLLSR